MVDEAQAAFLTGIHVAVGIAPLLRAGLSVLALHRIPTAGRRKAR